MSFVANKLGIWAADTAQVVGKVHVLSDLGFQYVALRVVVHDDQGNTIPYKPAALTQVVHEAALLKLPVIAWAYVYPHLSIQGQVDAISSSLPVGCTDLILDAEGEWEGVSASLAAQLTNGLRQKNPTLALHLSSFYAPEVHATFPFSAFLVACESFMPQSYVVGGTPVHLVLTRTMLQDPPLAKQTKAGLLIPTVNVPSILDQLIDAVIDGANVWLWDTDGDDIGVHGREGDWQGVIAKFKAKFGTRAPAALMAADIPAALSDSPVVAPPMVTSSPARVAAASALTPVGDFTTPAASSKTSDGNGASTTSGLMGAISQASDGSIIIDAVETITAKRNGHNLEVPRVVRQVRSQKGNLTTVNQADYCWGRRELPDAELVENFPGFGSDSDVFSGKATYFGKSDPEDEGTGTPAFGTVQTDSSVFGISLKQAQLLAEKLATLDADGDLVATDRGLRARVEVFFPKTGRLARLPLVDVGPGVKIKAVADLTVAASVFLQKLTEDELTKPENGDIDNIMVQARIVAS